MITVLQLLRIAFWPLLFVSALVNDAVSQTPSLVFNNSSQLCESGRQSVQLCFKLRVAPTQQSGGSVNSSGEYLVKLVVNGDLPAALTANIQPSIIERVVVGEQVCFDVSLRNEQVGGVAGVFSFNFIDATSGFVLGGVSTAVSCGQLECEINDLSVKLLLLDAGIEELRNEIFRAADKLKLAGRSGQRRANAVRKQASDLYLNSWTMVISYPMQITSCSGNEVESCLQSDYSPLVAGYSANLDRAFELLRSTVSELRKKSIISSQTVRRILRRGERLHGTLASTAASLPRVSNLCEL